MNRSIRSLALLFGMGASAQATALEPETARVAMAIAEAEHAARIAPAMAACYIDLAEAKTAAAKGRKPVVVWVALHCADHPEIREGLSDAIHCHQDTFGGSAEPRLVVLREGQTPVSWTSKSLTASRVAEIRKAAAGMDWVF